MPVRPLADILTHLLATDDVGLARAARTLGTVSRRRLVELVEGATPTVDELVDLFDLGVPLEACAEWLQLAG